MGTLVDSSIWIEHFRKRGGHTELRVLLNHESVFLHDFVYGELLLGGMSSSSEVKMLLNYLPRATCATQDEVEELVNIHKLHGAGIGWVDAHLIASCLLDDLDLLTGDLKLQKVWKRISL